MYEEVEIVQQNAAASSTYIVSCINIGSLLNQKVGHIQRAVFCSPMQWSLEVLKIKKLWAML